MVGPMKTAFADLIKLANKSDGKIPAEIPAHYTRWAYGVHRQNKGLRIVSLKFDKNRTNIIYL